MPTTCSSIDDNKGFSVHGMGLSIRFLESPEMEYPNSDEIENALDDAAYISRDKDHPLKGGSMAPVRNICKAMGVSVSQVYCGDGADGGISKATASRLHTKLGTTRRGTVTKLLRRLVGIAPNGGAAWFALSAVCYAPFEMGDSFYSKRAHEHKMKKIVECADRLDPEALDSLYLIACSLRDSQKTERLRSRMLRAPTTEFSKALVLLDYERRARYSVD